MYCITLHYTREPIDVSGGHSIKWVRNRIPATVDSLANTCNQRKHLGQFRHVVVSIHPYCVSAGIFLMMCSNSIACMRNTFVQLKRSRTSLRKAGETDRKGRSRYSSTVWNIFGLFLASTAILPQCVIPLFLCCVSAPCLLSWMNCVHSALRKNPKPKWRPTLRSVSLQDWLPVSLINLKFPSGSVFVSHQRFGGKIVVLGLISSEQSRSDLPTQACVWH